MEPVALLRGLYVITDETLTPPNAIVAMVAAALRGGARLVQYRDKSNDRERRQKEAAELLHLCREYGALLVVNDDVELAARIGADGVHLGRDDAPLPDARARLGTKAIIGLSCYDSLARAQAAARAGANYVAFGRFFPSQTKPRTVRARAALLSDAREQLSVPVAAIGGITAHNARSLVEAGADMLAVVHGVFGQPDCENRAREISRLYDDGEYLSGT
jgi:thiamine-phosphate pyrophosphorylase